MYNGIGLQTARGSGTNGYVQTNRFLVKPRLSKVITDSPSTTGFEGTAGLSRKANKEILEHDRKRQVQLKLLVLEEKLMDQGYTDNEIAEKVEEKRRELEAEAEVDALEDGEVGPTSLTNSRISDTQTHQIAARKERQMETLRAALGIGVESQNKLPAMLPSDSEDSNNEDEPANSHKKDGNSKKKLKGVVDNISDLRTVKESRENESAEDTFNESSRHKKQKSGRGRQDDLSESDDSDEKVMKRSEKRTKRKTSSDSDKKGADAKTKKKTSPKSMSTRRRHDSDSSDSGSDSDSSSDSDGGREHGRSLNKGEYHKRDVTEAMKKPRKNSSSSESDQSDDDKRRKMSSKKSSRSRRHDSDSSSSEYDSRSDTKSNSDYGSDRNLKKSLKKHESDKIPEKSKRRYESDDELEQEDRDVQSRRKSKEEQCTLRSVKVDIDLDDRKGRRDEDSRRYKPRSDVEVKHPLGSKLNSENQISDRWGEEPARNYDVARRESVEGRDRQGRKHRRDEEEDTRRINDRDGVQHQSWGNRREQDDRRSNKYDRDGDHDSAKRARYDDSRSTGRRYDEDDVRHGRKHSDVRHDERRSRR